MESDSYQCGHFHLDVANRRFSCRGAEVALEPKTFAVIVQLVSRAGVLVTRDELLDAVWGHRHVTRSALNRRITLARRAFSDDADEPKHIQTVHGAGYRYIGAVEKQAPAASTGPTLRFAPPLTARLPARTEALIGREQELAALAGQLRARRAVTVIGTGGMGKTQCALECARRIAAEYPDGVWFFDLAPMQDGAQWLRALAGALAIPPSEVSQLLGKLKVVLQSRRALLFLDNCDRIADEVGALVVELLRGIDTLTVLATSQKPLNFAGEQLLWLPPLGLPESPPGEPLALKDIETAPAVEMLLTRVRVVQPHFALSEASGPTVVEICRQLDGMPLALELVAARFALLSPEQVLQRLNQRFRFLGGDVAGRDQRHRNLLAMLDWSFSLLSNEEQELLDWLSVFVQGWTMDAVVHLAASMGRDPETAVEVMGGLHRKSLVSIAPGFNQPRYFLLETVREYALQRLRAAGQEPRARDAHLAYVVYMSALAGRDMVANRMRERVGELMYEHGNIGSAVEHAIHGETRRLAGLAIVGSLMIYVKARGPLDIGLLWCRRALAGTEALSSAERGRALLCQGITSAHLRDGKDSPEACLQEAAELARAHGDPFTEAYACGYLAMWQANAGLTERAEASLRVAQRIADRLEDAILRGLAGLARGWIQMAQGDLAAAVDTLWSVRDLGEDHHQRHFIRGYLGLGLIGLGRHAEAAAVLAEAMGVAIEINNVRGAAACLECCGYLCEKLGYDQPAARLLAAAGVIRERTAIPLFNFWLTYNTSAHAQLRTRLGPQGYEACSLAGRAMRSEDAINEAYARLKFLSAGAAQDPLQANP